MCGIAGFIEAREPDFDTHELCRSMGEAMRHRGPDAQAFVWLPEHGLGLAHARLAIIDLSPLGTQPMWSADKRLCVVFNGEIFNFREIRKELSDAGLAPQGGFKGGSDTEVLLAACRAWGVRAAVERFVGMFAFALWDDDAKTLTLARDRLGIKPLYYGLSESGFVFGSELKPLLKHPRLLRRLDHGALSLYCRFLYVPDPLCILDGLAKLPPGSMLTLAREDVIRRDLPGPVRYWRFEDVALAGFEAPLPAAEAEDALLDALRESVRLRLVSDVPLGAFLSGGIDSSLITALMQEQSGEAVRTFTIGFAEDGYDEAAHARAVAAHLGTNHTERILTSQDALNIVPRLPEFFDEPFADSSQIPTHLVSAMAREHVTVALSGDGGDELFGGYNRYLAGPKLWNGLCRVPGPLRRKGQDILRGRGERMAARLYSLAAPFLPPGVRQLAARDKMQKIVEAIAAENREDFYAGLVSIWRETRPLMRGAAASACLVDEPPESLSRLPFAAFMMAMDAMTYLPGDILTKVDRASMAVSLEARVPLLDHRLVALAWRVPLEQKIGPEGGKRILRRLLARYLPQEIMDRPKQGFAVPIDSWLRGPLKGLATDLLAPARLRDAGIFSPDVVSQILDEHLRGERNHQHRLWALIMFEAWREAHLS